MIDEVNLKENISHCIELLDKFNPEVFQKHLENASKVLDIFSKFATKSENNITNNIKPNIKKPLNKFFGK